MYASFSIHIDGTLEDYDQTIQAFGSRLKVHPIMYLSFALGIIIQI